MRTGDVSSGGFGLAVFPPVDGEFHCQDQTQEGSLVFEKSGRLMGIDFVFASMEYNRKEQRLFLTHGRYSVQKNYTLQFC